MEMALLTCSGSQSVSLTTLLTSAGKVSPCFVSFPLKEIGYEPSPHEGHCPWGQGERQVHSQSPVCLAEV